MDIPTKDYFIGNMSDYASDLVVIAILAALQCSATTILICWVITSFFGMRVTYRNMAKYDRGDA